MYRHYVNARVICIQDLSLSLNSTDSYNQRSKKVCKTNILEWAGLRRSIPLSLRSYDRYPSINSPTFTVGENIFDVTKGKSKDYYNLLIREKAKPPNTIKKLQSNFHFNSDNRKQISHATRHTPHATLHTPHATRHTPHATRHTPHATRHTLSLSSRM